MAIPNATVEANQSAQWIAGGISFLTAVVNLVALLVQARVAKAREGAIKGVLEHSAGVIKEMKSSQKDSLKVVRELAQISRTRG